MRTETRKKLERILWRERMKKVGIGLAILAALGVAMFYENLETQIVNVAVTGTIESVDPLVSKNDSAQGLNVGVKLDDGRHVRVIEFKSRHPHVGDQITIVEHRHATGRVTHSLR